MDLTPPFLGLVGMWHTQGWGTLYGSGEPFLSGICLDTSLGGHLGFFQFLAITNNSI